MHEGIDELGSDLTQEFIQTRNRLKRPMRSASNSAETESPSKSFLNKQISGKNIDRPNWEIESEQFSALFKNYKKNFESLLKLYSERLEPTFDVKRELKLDRKIEKASKYSETLMVSMENGIKRISLYDTKNSKNNPHISKDEQTIRLNSMKYHAYLLRKTSTVFNKKQADFFNRLAAQKSQFSHKFRRHPKFSVFNKIPDENGTEMAEPQTLQKLEKSEKMDKIEEMEHLEDLEIERMARSTRKISVLYKELNHLILEQRTKLDRIEFAVEYSAGNLDLGVSELEKEFWDFIRLRELYGTFLIFVKFWFANFG